MEFIKQQECAIGETSGVTATREWIIGVVGAVACYGSLIWLISLG